MSTAAASPEPDPEWRERQVATAKAWTEPDNWSGDNYTGPGLPPWGNRPRCPVVRNGRRCRKSCIPGGTVCNTHGGAAPQVRNRAKLRLLALVDPALSTLARTLATSQDEGLKTKIAFGILDRTGLGKAQDVSAEVAKAVLMERYYSLREQVAKERADAGLPPLDNEWIVGAAPTPATELEAVSPMTEMLDPDGDSYTEFDFDDNAEEPQT